MSTITSLGTGAFPIGELSRLSGVNIETIRYYERISMLSVPSRTGGGRRVYGPLDVKTLKFIRRGRELGFTLDEIRNLLRLSDGTHNCREVKTVALAHLTDVRRKIADLRRMEQTLTSTVELCESGDAMCCPVLSVLSE